jgi:archaellum component FlaC
MIHCEQIESSLKERNKTLTEQLEMARLDYEDSVTSRRELQQRIKDLEYDLENVSQDNNVLKQRNPYVLVLVDGDGLIVRARPEP